MSGRSVNEKRFWAVPLLWATLALVACSSPTKRPVVIEDRPMGRASTPAASAPAKSTTAETSVATASGVASSADVASNAGKPGFYTVKPGDTLVRIGLDHGQNWRDIARWNQIDNPNLIEVGQVLRVRPEALTTRPVTRPAERPASGSTPAPSASAAPRGTPSAGGAAAAQDAHREPPLDAAPAELSWAWPASGPVLQGFDEQRNKGLDIGGKAGDAVLAAADGRVVYAGSALRGYGNLVILKHNSTFLSAYAHNQSLLVKEDQVVKRGQKIAEMGSTDAERVQLHFEIRRDGKPVDPARFLPPR